LVRRVAALVVLITSCCTTNLQINRRTSSGFVCVSQFDSLIIEVNTHNNDHKFWPKNLNDDCVVPYSEKHNVRILNLFDVVRRYDRGIKMEVIEFAL